MTIKRSTLLKIILPIFIISLSVIGFSSLKSSKTERKKPEIKEKTWLVETINASLERLSADLTLYATIESPALQSASSPAPALVKSIHVSKGTQVNQGDVLITLEQSDFLNNVHQAEADVHNIKAQLQQLDLKHESNKKASHLETQLLTLRQAELNRVLRLQKQGLGADSTLSDAKSALAKQQLAVLNKASEVAQYKPQKQQLLAQLKRANANLAQQQSALKRSTITADFAGTIVSINVAAGDRVQTAQTLITLYPTQQLEAKTRIPARFQYEIQHMLNTQKPVKARAHIGGKTITLELDRMAGQAAANGIEVYFRITQGQEHLRIGNFLKLQMQRQAQDNLIKIPLQSLYGTARIYRLKNERLQGLDVETIGYHQDDNGKNYLLIRHPDIQQNDQIVTTHLPNAISGLKAKTSEKQ